MSQTAPSLTALAHGGGCGCKISPSVLREILGAPSAALTPPNLLIDAATSDDAAVYKLSDDTALVATTDFFTPIVDDPETFGRIAATNALSDIYAMGAKPLFCLAIVGMPIDKLPSATIAAILAGGRAVADAAGAPVAGGHSIDSAEPIYGLAAIGAGHPDRLLTNAGARAGDVLILGKPLGVGVFSAALKQGKLSEADYETMVASTLSLNSAGADLAGLEGAHALTDVTGFGLLGHLSEVCRASNLAARLDHAAIPVFSSARSLAHDGVRTGASGRNWASLDGFATLAPSLDDAERDLLTDPQTSGGLLLACAESAAGAALDIFARHGQPGAAVVGRLEAGDPAIDVSA